ncbi:hypothetical protein E4K72_22845 [Oxalobacteraceae bacterium OM1]|nr:hypothetical protein E4K72_22845 [Oxalobacteraceae bacterium OM1]
MRTSSVWLLASAMVLSAALGGCGGSDVSSMTASNTETGTGTITGTGTGTTAPGAATGSGSLLAVVMSLLGGRSDTDQPVPVDAVDAQTSDTAQPEPVS